MASHLDHHYTNQGLAGVLSGSSMGGGGVGGGPSSSSYYTHPLFTPQGSLTASAAIAAAASATTTTPETGAGAPATAETPLAQVSERERRMRFVTTQLRRPQPPAILQRLLGPAAANETLHASPALATAPGAGELKLRTPKDWVSSRLIKLMIIINSMY